jgi:hypothetical protein
MFFISSDILMTVVTSQGGGGRNLTPQGGTDVDEVGYVHSERDSVTVGAMSRSDDAGHARRPAPRVRQPRAGRLLSRCAFWFVVRFSLSFVLVVLAVVGVYGDDGEAYEAGRRRDGVSRKDVLISGACHIRTSTLVSHNNIIRDDVSHRDIHS